MMYCAAVRRMADTFSSRPNISCQWPVASCQLRPGGALGRNLSLVLTELNVEGDLHSSYKCFRGLESSSRVTEVIRSSGSTGNRQLLSRSLLELVQQEVQHHAQQCIRQ